MKKKFKRKCNVNQNVLINKCNIPSNLGKKK